MLFTRFVKNLLCTKHSPPGSSSTIQEAEHEDSTDTEYSIEPLHFGYAVRSTGRIAQTGA